MNEQFDSDWKDPDIFCVITEAYYNTLYYNVLNELLYKNTEF